MKRVIIKKNGKLELIEILDEVDILKEVLKIAQIMLNDAKEMKREKERNIEKKGTKNV